mmetsp:Transcript_13215/g.26964  ORF Transcript_13215/g.26964 Transcript_13215/m.26964 type:complete len:423 (+) Transcript_13215:180-1448(+)|eukprot:CAMPEP_0118638806 /NCGR_PEP_ID=MMETSP0785-20121206/3893_1 /TAXON_ID=91992 /ORGANISM="Bolidomonas pacifica, Strain CCMP 1866" /LENGTH=422 /DNA_ID=CAMNT_0006530105 /DNA_START=164 /DNA_END=1432 /DNA_ORIENTATION=+
MGSSSLRLPTQVCYALIGVGLGILAACQLFELHNIEVEEGSMFGYGCHEEESKPIMRGLLHLIACGVCMCTLITSYLLYGSTRHPSDFVMAFFSMQYFASAVFHRHRMYPTVVSIFTNVDIGWIACTIIGCSMMVRLKKLRHVIYCFSTFVGMCFLYEMISHGIPEQRKISAGQWIEHLNFMKRGIEIKTFIYSLGFEPWVWVGLKSISGISFALIPFFSPAALNFSKYDRTQKFLFLACFCSYLMAFVCFGLQTASRKGFLKVKIGWHVKNVWGYHEDFHLILVIAHTFTSQMYDVMFQDVIEGGGAVEGMRRIIERIEKDYQEDYVHFLNENFGTIRSSFHSYRNNRSLTGLHIRSRLSSALNESNIRLSNFRNKDDSPKNGSAGKVAKKGSKSRSRSRASSKKSSGAETRKSRSSSRRR